MSESYICIHECHHIGISGTTPVFFKRHEDGRLEARMGIAIFGMTNMDPEHLKMYSDPFDENFRDNYVKGFGATEQETLEALKKDADQMSESLWF